MGEETINNNERGSRGLSGSKILAGIFGILILVMAVLFLFYPQAVIIAVFNAGRIKNTFSYYILQEKPHFYYLDMEKNGKNIRVNSNQSLEVTYRDEFAVKAVASDDLAGKYISVDVEGLGKGKNDIGVLLKGMDLVDKIMQEGVMSQGGGTVSTYKIIVNYKNEALAGVPMKVVITPQDWLRFAKDTANVHVKIEYLKKAVELNPADTGVRKILAGIYSRQGRPDDAISHYKSVLSLSPGDVTALRELAKEYIKKKEYDRAAEAAHKLVQISPQDAEAYAVLGYSFEEKGLWEKAIESYSAAVKNDPENYPVRFRLGDAYVRVKKIHQAIEQYEYIVRHSKDKTLALIALGDAYLKLKKFDEAIQCYKEAVSHQPRSAVAYANLAAAYAGKGKDQEELEHLKKAAALDPDEPVIRFNLGAAYEKRKLDAEAAREY
ncbi:MAG TPA: tetratricopeptide repeat protein, partial [Smithellaceae bacterium]|nr:tetratricopeptide repeat protein [Smithellaceae bacterium]